MNDVLPPNLRLIGRYSVLREVRRDKSSVTYLAMDSVMNREVVLKTVQLPLPGDAIGGAEAEISALEAAFVRQAQAAGKLHHPHIVTTFDAGRIHHLAYMAIEKVAGSPLHELLAKGWRPDFVHAASVAARIADALEYAHGQGVAHGHLGPQHVIMQSGGAPKIEGFGGWIDGGTGGEDALARTEHLLPYFQNEVTDESRRRDVRAVATLLYMMLAARAPKGEPPASVLSYRSDAPAALARLIDTTLDPANPASNRTAGDLRDALTAFLWTERKEHVAPGTIGIPLTRPPADTDVGAPPTVRLPTRPASVDAAIREAQEAAPRAPARARPTFVARLAAGPLADQMRALIARARAVALPWLRANRIAVGGMGGLLLAGLVIGVFLGNVARVEKSAADAAKVGPVAPAVVSGAGVVTLEISPWGEVYVDSKPVGVTPPLTELKLDAGRHTIEIRHGTRPSVVAQVDVDPAKPAQIRHRFD
jgi:serine/threonine-protein kinase